MGRLLLNRARLPILPLFLAGFLPPGSAATGAEILLVVNGNSPVSREIGAYYRPRRAVPLGNVCTLASTQEEEIDWKTYLAQIENPVADCLKRAGLTESVLYIVLTMGIPLKVSGSGGEFLSRESASVDSELTLLYAKLKGRTFERAGPAPNPFFMKRDAPFRHPLFPVYLVTRLAAYDVAEVKGMIDRGLAAHNRGKFVLDLSDGGNAEGNGWLRNAATLLPGNRVILDDSSRILTDQKEVIGYASWGSNDAHRARRWLHNEWLPGAIAMEFVSTGARTLRRPPDEWKYTTWQDRFHFWGGSPQSLTADFLHEGASGAEGNAYEPMLAGCARPDYVLPAYFEGRNLAESFYLGLPYLSWQSIVFGDPLCALGKP